MTNSINLKEKICSWRTLTSFALAFVVLLLLLSKIDISKTWVTIKHAQFSWYALAFVVYYLAFPIRAIRFRLMLKNNNIKSSIGTLNLILLISWFANCIVPAKIGDLFRGYLIKQKYRLAFMKTMGVIFVERVFDLFILYVVIGVTGIIGFQGKVPETIMYVFKIGFVFILILLAVVLGLIKFGYRIEKFVPKRVEAFYRRFLTGTVDSMHDNGKLALLTVAIWFMEGLSFYFVARAINLQLPFTVLIFIALVSALMTALPVTPAGLGIVEAAKVGILVIFGQSQEIAVTAALMDRLINYWSLLVVGLIIYLTKFNGINKGGITVEGHDSNSHV